MEEFVPKSQIMKDLGGDEDWIYQYIEPVAGENDKMMDIKTRDRLLAERGNIVKNYEKATLDWIHSSSGTDLSDIKTRRHELANTLRDDYWRVDPYLRARSYYDRVGMISPSGKLQLYPGKAEAANGSHQVETSADDID
jgi:hypothetical protein